MSTDNSKVSKPLIIGGGLLLATVVTALLISGVRSSSRETNNCDKAGGVRLVGQGGKTVCIRKDVLIHAPSGTKD